MNSATLLPRVAERLTGIARVMWVILWLNVVVALAKLAYGFRSGALAITADGIHSLLDSASNVIGLIAISVARRPADSNHPYGHRKYETFAALGVAIMLFIGCWEIGTTAFERLRHPRLPAVGPIGYAVLVTTLIVNSLVVVYERRAAKRLQSELLESDAAHTGSDVFATLLVLASFVAIRFRLGWADVAAAGLIVVLIVLAGVRILKGTLSTLSDERRLAPEEVESEALLETGVREVHNVRSRGTADDIHLDLHVLLDPTTPLAVAHELAHRVERRLRDRWPGVSDVVVHVEPALESERARERVGGGLRAEG
ncbi:MAG: cation transporter [Candidatus Eisenbacteria bacterium]|uniref:Cation transporter n=1 Tax=Eiseniibacteriota bacterium TaxID=2212470 RepID=A0A538U5F3_UNCEI|nr:MAG: cation transporter [Candidatus Eisenbacteria bacterium]